jgi:NAD(P)H dehydrogenase (quinone)
MHIKLSIVYHSVTGNTKRVAGLIEEGAQKVQGVETKVMSIDDCDFDFMKESDCIIFGTPTYLGTFSWQMKGFFDKGLKVKLAGKMGAVFATENFIGGGADFALLSLIGHMLVKGMLVFSGGVSEGHPYTHFGAVCIKDGDDNQKERAILFGERIVNKAAEIYHN